MAGRTAPFSSFFCSVLELRRSSLLGHEALERRGVQGKATAGLVFVQTRVHEILAQVNFNDVTVCRCAWVEVSEIDVVVRRGDVEHVHVAVGEEDARGLSVTAPAAFRSTSKTPWCERQHAKQ